jgi:DNA-binding NarL/FixJ family response regulator
MNEFARSLLARFPSLTAREADVVSRLAHGMSNADIAASLSITEKTVKNVLLPVSLKMGLPAEDRGGSLRVRLTLTAHGIAY